MRLLPLLLALSLSANAATRFASLDRAFDILAANNRLRGSVALMKDGKVIYQRAVGEGVGPRTMLRVGSVTKVFTAAMIFQLIEEKKLTLDTKLARFFPQIPNAERITVAQLLAHSSGIPNIPRGDEPWVQEAQTEAQMVARFAAAKPDFTPGEKTAYSNPNFVLLGYIIESVTRSPYAEQLDRRIVRKLGLACTRYGGAVDPKNDEAYSFLWDDGKWNRQAETHGSVPAGAGAILSTPADLAKFVSALFTNQLIRASGVREMLTGKGINVHTLGGIEKKAYSHLGGVDAYSANLLYIPEERLAVAITLNGPNYPMKKVFWLLVNAYYGRPLEEPSFTAKMLPAATLDGFAGTYGLQGTDFAITIRREGDRLTAQATGQDAFPLEAIGNALFSHPPSGILMKLKDGQLTLDQGRSTTVFVRNSSR